MVLLAFLALPFALLFLTALRAAILFWPVMLLLGAVHSYLPWVPALGWWPTVLVVALLGLLIPVGSVNGKD